MSNLMVRVTFSPPSTSVESIAVTGVSLWSHADRLQQGRDVTIRDIQDVETVNYWTCISCLLPGCRLTAGQ